MGRRNNGLIDDLCDLAYRWPWLTLPIALVIFVAISWFWHHFFFNFIGGITMQGTAPFADVTKSDIARYGGSILGLMLASPVLIVGLIGAVRKSRRPRQG